MELQSHIISYFVNTVPGSLRELVSRRCLVFRAWLPKRNYEYVFGDGMKINLRAQLR